MTDLMIDCPTCNGDGFISFEDRHVENAKESCPTCKGRMQVPARTGETPQTSAPLAITDPMTGSLTGKLSSHPAGAVPDGRGWLLDAVRPFCAADASHPAGHSAGSGAEDQRPLRMQLADVILGGVRMGQEGAFTDLNKTLDNVLALFAPNSTRTGQGEALRSAMIRALDGHTAHSRDCHMSGEYLCQQVWPLVEAAIAVRPVVPEAAQPPVTDPVVEAVRADLHRRSQVGLAKYGTPLSRTDLKLRDWANHAYEEALDMANYLKRTIMELDGEFGSDA